MLGGTGKGHLADAYLMDVDTNKARQIKEDKGMPVWASSQAAIVNPAEMITLMWTLERKLNMVRFNPITGRLAAI